MEIRIMRSQAERVGYPKLEGFGIPAYTWQHRTEQWVNLRSLTLDQAKQLKTLFMPFVTVRYVGALTRDIQTWIDANDAAEFAKDKPLDRLITMPVIMKAFLKQYGPRYWIYKKEGNVPGSYLPYYVTAIEYHKPVRHEDYTEPAYVDLDLFNYDLGKLERGSITWRQPEITGQTCREVLLNKGYYLETQNIYQRYMEELERFGEIVKKVGKQYLASGKTTNGHYLEYDGDPGKVVGDTLINEVENPHSGRGYRGSTFDPKYWEDEAPGKKEEKDVEEEGSEELRAMARIDIPQHLYVDVFHLQKHITLNTHVNNLTDYVYDKTMVDRLILPEGSKALVHLLIEHKDAGFQDVVKGKAGGAVVVLSGAPGTGKTLTAECFAESEEKPLYSVQASQLGLDAEELEKNLKECLGRAKRWNAIMLIDEADVYVKDRGGDLIQNAIVGVFLRILEYHKSILFFTTNRPDIIDDAILSRCVAKIDYKAPVLEDQRQIWRILANLSKIKIDEETIQKVSEKYSQLSGRDVKNLLKLANLYSKSKGDPITAETIAYVKQFKPTADLKG